MDKGPWRADVYQDYAYVVSDDFEHDVRLRVSGDFADAAQRAKYAEWLADTLNKALTTGISGEG